MTNDDSATLPAPVAVAARTGPAARGGVLLAALGVVAFSLSFPATRWALEGFGVWSISGVRCVLAAVLAAAGLLAARVPFPERRHRPGLLVVSVGCVLGFPFLSTLALRTTSTSHAAVVIGALPLATAAFAALRTGRRPSRAFWLGALGGAAAVTAFTLLHGDGTPGVGDLCLVGALLLCAAGYAEGGRLSAVLPGWQVMAWALVAALPVTVPVAAVALAAEPVRWSGHALLGLGWLAAVAQFGGFVLWYRGMAAIGVARGSQLQLAQPLLTLVWAALLLGEGVPAAAPVTAVAVLACIAVTQRARS
ncbi:DMT family transporter [Streptomyces sp. NPDC092296]|uniref:DMT family transporter n=1 Tax=Streptomyces sp. NPDC092296 TaxID=3366012 RepID=UPI0037FFA70B